MNLFSKRLFRRSVSLLCSSSLIWVSFSISFNSSFSSFCLSIRSSSFFSLLSTFISSFLACLFFLLLLTGWWNLPCLSLYISRSFYLIVDFFLNIFAISGKTENLFPFLSSILLFDFMITSFTNLLNHSGIRLLTILRSFL